MTLLGLLVAIATIATLGLGLIRRWTMTPYGRIRPIFAIAFKMQHTFQPKTGVGARIAEKIGRFLRSLRSVRPNRPHSQHELKSPP